MKGLELGKREQQRKRAGAGKELGSEMWRDRIEYLRSYPWSSYRCHIGLEARPPWLMCDQVLSWMGGARSTRAKAYCEYVESGAREALKRIPWEQWRGQLAPGKEAFVEKMQRHAKGDEQEQPGVRGLRKRIPFARVVEVLEEIKGERWSEFVNRRGDWGRDMVLCLAR